jgi:hypothetical protein
MSYLFVEGSRLEYVPGTLLVGGAEIRENRLQPSSANMIAVHSTAFRKQFGRLTGIKIVRNAE